MAEFDISNFGGGLNESVSPTLITQNEAQSLWNVDIKNGSLKPVKSPGLTGLPICPVDIVTLMVYFNQGEEQFVIAGAGSLYLYNGTSWVQLGTGFASDKWDFINYKYNNEDVMILVNGEDNNKILQGTTLRDMKDRRISYDENGAINGYYDANGVLKATEAEVTTLAPKAKFIELHFERVWLGDDYSVYFSKDFDPEDFTIPVTELEANMHGGEIVMESFDATKIIGMKVVFNDVVIFKEKSLFKIVGAYAEQYEKIQLFNFNGAIADKSIVITSKGAFFLNTDGIYQYDGVGCYLISDKVQRTIDSLDGTKIADANAVNYNNRYILIVDYVPTSGKITIEFDYENAVFTRNKFNLNGLLNVVHRLYGHSGKNIFEYGKGNYMPIEWTSGWYDLDVPNAIKECEDIYITGKGTSASNPLGVSLITERKEKRKDIFLDASKLKVVHKPLINFGRVFQIHLSTELYGYVEITSMKVIFDVDAD